jgi:hypothetical protein
VRALRFRGHWRGLGAQSLIAGPEGLSTPEPYLERIRKGGRRERWRGTSNAFDVGLTQPELVKARWERMGDARIAAGGGGREEREIKHQNLKCLSLIPICNYLLYRSLHLESLSTPSPPDYLAPDRPPKLATKPRGEYAVGGLNGRRDWMPEASATTSRPR